MDLCDLMASREWRARFCAWNLSGHGGEEMVRDVKECAGCLKVGQLDFGHKS